MAMRMRVTAWVGVTLVVTLAAGAAASGQISVQPQTIIGSDAVVLLFDNETGETATGLGIVFAQPVVVDGSSVVAFGGGAAGALDTAGRIVWIPVEVAPGGTLQVGLSVRDVQVVAAMALSLLSTSKGN